MDQPQTDQPQTDQPQTDQPKTDQPKTDQYRLVEGLLRGGQRATVHLLRAGVETLRAVSVLLEEIERARHPDPDDEEGPQRIEVL